MSGGAWRKHPQRSLLTCLTLCAGTVAASEPADFVFRGGAVYTVEAERPWARAVAVTGGHIVYVGDEKGVEAWIGEPTEVIEIADGMVMPGFHDSHMHPMAAGTTYLRCPLNDLLWPDEVLARLSQCAAELKEGEWLRATGLSEQVLEGAGPGRALLDRVSNGHAAMISSRLSQMAWINTPALEAAGIDASATDPAHGQIVRDPETGQPTGVIRGAAVGLVWRAIPDYPEAALREGLRLASRLANSYGITSANEAATSRAHWAAYRAADQAGEMTIRVNASLRWNPDGGIEQLQTLRNLRARAVGQRFRADSIKLFLDGDVRDRTAKVLEPYPGTTQRGMTRYGKALTELVRQVDGAGFQIHMHAYGDQAVRDGLDAIQHAAGVNPSWDRRHQMAHLALVHPDDLKRFPALGVTADIQPLWAWLNDQRTEECKALGEVRCARLLPFRDLFDSGANVVAGSDWISESMNPLYGIQVAVTRRPPDREGPPWNPHQRATLAEMLAAYTVNGARLAGQASSTGSIQVGKAADLVLLESNLFEVDPMQIRNVSVLLTLLEGQVVYRRGEEQERKTGTRANLSSRSRPHTNARRTQRP